MSRVKIAIQTLGWYALGHLIVIITTRVEEKGKVVSEFVNKEKKKISFSTLTRNKIDRL